MGTHCCVRCRRKRNEECEDRETHDDVVGWNSGERTKLFRSSSLPSTSYRSFTESRSSCAENSSDARRLPHRACQRTATVVGSEIPEAQAQMRHFSVDQRRTPVHLGCGGYFQSPCSRFDVCVAYMEWKCRRKPGGVGPPNSVPTVSR